MENLISPLRFKKSNYVIRLFSNKRLCPLVGQSVCLSVGHAFLKTANNGQIHRESLLSPWEDHKSRFSQSINESRTQSITHSNLLYRSQGVSLAYVGLVISFSTFPLHSFLFFSPSFSDAPRISIRGRVCPSVRRSVSPSFCLSHFR